jgi:hypothetical protein
MDLRSRGEPLDWFLLAMTHWRLGERIEAQKWYDKGIEAISKQTNRTEDDGWIQIEAAELLRELETAAPP